MKADIDKYNYNNVLCVFFSHSIRESSRDSNTDRNIRHNYICPDWQADSNPSFERFN